VEAPQDVIVSLKIITEEYSDYDSLMVCASGQLKSRLKELASVPDLASLVVSQPQLFENIISDAVLFRDLQSTTRYSCHFCRKVVLCAAGSVLGNPMCCKNRTGYLGRAYIPRDG